MSKLVVHAKIMIDGVSDTPKKDQLISIEDGKIVSIEEYHETNEEVIHANVVTPGFFNCHVHIMEPVGYHLLVHTEKRRGLENIASPLFVLLFNKEVV